MSRPAGKGIWGRRMPGGIMMDPNYVTAQLLEAYGGLPKTMEGLRQMLLDAYLLGIRHGKIQKGE